MKERKITIGIILIIVATFFIGCLAMYGVMYFFPVTLNENITKIIKDVTVNDNGISDAVEKVYDSVVIVKVYKNNTYKGHGTGFVYKKENGKIFILTNNHVIDKMDKVTLTFTDNKTVECEIVGTNALNDIAVLAINDNDNINVANVGSSNNAKVGDTVFTVGAPIDSAYSWTVTRGVLSGKDRLVDATVSDETGEYVIKVLQTDSAINEGNSGGPLCNANGEVIGITSMKLVASSVDGIGFAIPIETAITYAEKIINKEKIEQPYIGISMINVADGYYYRDYYNYLASNEITSGVIIVDVEKNSAASKAGLKSNDVIVKINENDTPSIGYLRYYLYEQGIGKTVKITYIRNGDAKTTNLTLSSK